jgi:hypothetical protein
MTLDAGGTNFVFSAMQANRPVVQSFALPANADNLERSLSNIVAGFGKVQSNNCPRRRWLSASRSPPRRIISTASS